MGLQCCTVRAEEASLRGHSWAELLRDGYVWLIERGVFSHIGNSKCKSPELQSFPYLLYLCDSEEVCEAGTR